MINYADVVWRTLPLDWLGQRQSRPQGRNKELRYRLPCPFSTKLVSHNLWRCSRTPFNVHYNHGEPRDLGVATILRIGTTFINYKAVLSVLHCYPMSEKIWRNTKIKFYEIKIAQNNFGSNNFNLIYFKNSTKNTKD